MIPWLAIRLEQLNEQLKYFSASHLYVPILGFAVILAVYSLSKQINANEFLAAFTAGVTVASAKSPLKERFFRLSESLAEIFKLGALFVFGSLMSVQILKELNMNEVLFIVFAIVLARPCAMAISLLGSNLDWKERVVVGCYGPKGFASVVFGLVILSSNITNKNHLFHLVALVVVGSIVLLSSTDVLVEKWMDQS